MRMLDAADVGSRVVVRYLLRGQTGPMGHPLRTDVIGTLERFDGDRVVVRRVDGERVSVAATDVVAAKRVPPAPRRRSRGAR
jgi:N-acetylglutamate synthase